VTTVRLVPDRDRTFTFSSEDWPSSMTTAKGPLAPTGQPVASRRVIAVDAAVMFETIVVSTAAPEKSRRSVLDI
jgi:hypothetical protein